MSATVISAVIFACMIAGIVAGRVLRRVLPQDHLDEDSKDTIKISSGLIATLTALVLGLLVSSASGTFNTQKAELEQIAANIVQLDRVLAQYGPETATARAQLRQVVELRIRALWPEEAAPGAAQPGDTVSSETLQRTLRALAPGTDVQKALQAQALGIIDSLGQTRALLVVQHLDHGIPQAFIAILAVWTWAIFTAFSLFAPGNATVNVALLICVVSVTCAVFLILELGSPYSGVVKLSSQPLQTALHYLGQP